MSLKIIIIYKDTTFFSNSLPFPEGMCAKSNQSFV
ncbi:hypothetical protein EVA_21836 [gut metagenome]|uniref:Uncharacterized protein n=1 Tax=gut metagenome TaxID=749906 RepID=J9F6I5_9ZZZZ